MDKIRFVARIFLVTTLLLSFSQTARADPIASSRYYGEVHVLDNPPIAGSVIEAYVPDVAGPAGTAILTSSDPLLLYDISINGDDPVTPYIKEGGVNSDIITFRYGTRILGTALFQSGLSLSQNLHPPQAISGGPYSGNEGSNIAFSGSANDYGTDVATYAWDMDSNPATFEITGQTPSVTFPNSGVFTVRLRVTDGLSGEGIASTEVTVNNVAPTLTTFTPSVSVNEGSTANNSGSVTDPGNDISSITASIGSVINNGDGTWSWTYVPTDGPESPTVTITATDADGATGTTTFTLVVNNVAPVGSLGNNGPVPEGSPATISFSGQGDPSTLDTVAGFHYAFACDNGSLAAATYANSSASSSTTCTFPDGPATYTVRARILDKDNGFSEYFTYVDVSNAAPVLTVNQTTVTVNEGTTATNSGTISDPGTDPLTIYTEYGSVTDNGNGTWSWSYFAGAGPGDSRQIAIQASDGDSGYGGVTFNLVVNNVAPTADAGGPYTVNEGSPVNFVGTAYDPGTDDMGIFDYYWDFDYVSPTFTYDASGSATVSPTYSNAGVYIAAFRVEDSQFAVGLDTTTVTIVNTPPSNVSPGGPYTVTPNSLLNLYGSATCVAVDTCSYAWDLDNDGQYDDYTGIIASYTWTLEGVYTIGLRVTDDDGTSATGSTTVTVASTVTHSIPLVAGWNLVSFNIHPVDGSTTAVLSSISGNFSLVYAWDASGAHASSGNWLLYDPLVPSFLNSLTSLSEGQGFWIQMTAADTLEVTGNIVTASSIALYDNTGGWNLVGYPSITNRALPGAIPAETNEIYAYHASDTLDSWKLFDRDFPIFDLNDLTTLTPGWGYWMFVTGDSTWNIAY